MPHVLRLSRRHKIPQLISRRWTSQRTANDKTNIRTLDEPPEPEPSRHWIYALQKFSNWAIIPGAILYAVFFADFGEREHVFSPPRRWLERQKDAFFSLSPAERELTQVDVPAGHERQPGDSKPAP